LELLLLLKINWTKPDPTIRAAPKWVQLNLVGLGRLATQQTLFFFGGARLKQLQPITHMVAGPT